MHESDREQALFAHVERTWAEAVLHQDRAALEQVLAPEYTLVVSAAPTRPVPRDRWLAQALGPYQVRGYAIDGLTTRRVHDDVVAVSLILTTEATVGGVDRSMTFFIVDLWRRSGDGWQVVQRYSALPEPPSASAQAVMGDQAGSGSAGEQS